MTRVVREDGFELTRGFLLARTRGGQPVAIFAARAPSALTHLAAELGRQSRLPSECRGVDRGFVVCRDDGANLAPAGRGAEIHRRLANQLPDVRLLEAPWIVHFFEGSTPVKEERAVAFFIPASEMMLPFGMRALGAAGE